MGSGTGHVTTIRHCDSGVYARQCALWHDASYIDPLLWTGSPACVATGPRGGRRAARRRQRLVPNRPQPRPVPEALPLAPPCAEAAACVWPARCRRSLRVYMQATPRANQQANRPWMLVARKVQLPVLAAHGSSTHVPLYTGAGRRKPACPRQARGPQSGGLQSPPGGRGTPLQTRDVQADCPSARPATGGFHSHRSNPLPKTSTVHACVGRRPQPAAGYAAASVRAARLRASVCRRGSRARRPGQGPTSRTSSSDRRQGAAARRRAPGRARLRARPPRGSLRPVVSTVLSCGGPRRVKGRRPRPPPTAAAS